MPVWSKTGSLSKNSPAATLSKSGHLHHGHLAEWKAYQAWIEAVLQTKSKYSASNIKTLYHIKIIIDINSILYCPILSHPNSHAMLWLCFANRFQTGSGSVERDAASISCALLPLVTSARAGVAHRGFTDQDITVTWAQWAHPRNPRSCTRCNRSGNWNL